MATRAPKQDRTAKSPEKVCPPRRMNLRARHRPGSLPYADRLPTRTPEIMLDIHGPQREKSTRRARRRSIDTDIAYQSIHQKR